ncbi:hypothetical protein TTRE_0000504901 [Trichuris trichiura]|uniref:Cystatin domain-containing protein n=1 Tax=Trichuris trichiura TaxID=36087 RepID=A0A077Z8I6_TRITR|nr:hypothetical protein TTRE_0000504901 [Trichuris trichiura]
MVAILKLSVVLFCLASVGAIEDALLKKFAEAAVNGINNDNDSGDKLFKVFRYFGVIETDKAITFDLIAVQTSCQKGKRVDVSECESSGSSPVLQHKVIATKKPGGVYSVASTGPMDPDSTETLSTLTL